MAPRMTAAGQMSGAASGSETPRGRREDFLLGDGSRVAVIGGGPAGSFFSYFLLSMAERIPVELALDIYEPRDFSKLAPAGCNMCGGVISESLVQVLAAEGLALPASVVQRGIDSYVLHMDAGSVRIGAPRREKRIAAVHRGPGPRGLTVRKWESFDRYLLSMARAHGAELVPERVEAVTWEEGRPRLKSRRGISEPYDVVVGATGVNSSALKLFAGLGLGYAPPKTARTFISEYYLGGDLIDRYLGDSMHVFLLDFPRLEFAALIPKGDYVTLAMLGQGIDQALVDSFLACPEVKRCFPPGWSLPPDPCRCFPAINVDGAAHTFADRFVFVGDSGVSRLYKDGIGGAYRTAKAAARTALFEGVSAEAFRRIYRPVCRDLQLDNDVGKLIFGVTHLLQHSRLGRRGLLRMILGEQTAEGRPPRMSGVLWDTFTGSAPYRDVLKRTLDPRFLGRLLLAMGTAATSTLRKNRAKEGKMVFGGKADLGRSYRPGELIIRQGDPGDCMYVIQAGQVEVVREAPDGEKRLAVLGPGDVFGEMALFHREERRSATVRPLGEVRALSVDRKMFLRKIHDDPSIAFSLMQRLARRIRQLDEQVAPGPTSAAG
jgi:flavin-dependent dehydrogenase